MRLTDIVSAFGLTFFPIVGLLIFLAVFVAVSVRAVRTPRGLARAWAALPLEDGDRRAGGAEGAGRDGAEGAS